MPDDIAPVKKMAELFDPSQRRGVYGATPRRCGTGGGAIPPRLGKQVWQRAVLLS